MIWPIYTYIGLCSQECSLNARKILQWLPRNRNGYEEVLKGIEFIYFFRRRNSSINYWIGEIQRRLGEAIPKVMALWMTERSRKNNHVNKRTLLMHSWEPITICECICTNTYISWEFSYEKHSPQITSTISYLDLHATSGLCMMVYTTQNKNQFTGGKSPIISLHIGTTFQGPPKCMSNSWEGDYNFYR